MRVEISRHALGRVPLSIIFYDSTLLVNLNCFFMRDRNPIDGQRRRWEDVPVVHPESFTREFAEYCLDLPVRTPELALRFTGREIKSVSVDGTPVARVHNRSTFGSRTFYEENGATYVAFDPQRRTTAVDIL